MKFQFKQAVSLRGKDGKGKDYTLGFHEVSDDHQAHPFFEKLVKAGLVHEAGVAALAAAKPVSSHSEHMKVIADKLAKTSAPQPQKESDAASVEAQSPAPEAASVDEESKEKPKKSKSSK